MDFIKFQYDFNGSFVNINIKDTIDDSNYQDLAEKLLHINTDSVPEGMNVISIGTDYKWGEVIFSDENWFYKAIYTKWHKMRHQPYKTIDHTIEILSYASENGIEMPEFFGYFSVCTQEGFIWNGIILKNLSDYSNLDESNENDYLLMKNAIENFCENGIYNHDMHFENVMKNGDSFKTVDFDRCEIVDKNDKQYAIKMAEKCVSLLKNENAIAYMNSYIDELKK